jgi:hypothetical protein
MAGGDDALEVILLLIIECDACRQKKGGNVANACGLSQT